MYGHVVVSGSGFPLNPSAIVGPTSTVTTRPARRADVNGVDYGLTCSIWTPDLSTAYRTAMAVDVGYVWINDVGKHFLGAPFGGVKQSGFGREECFEEMLSFTREKSIHAKL